MILSPRGKREIKTNEGGKERSRETTNKDEGQGKE